MLTHTSRQRGQALLIVLSFIAVFTLILWAAAFYASGSFKAQRNVIQDTQATYAADAGLQWALAYVRLNIPPCSSGPLNVPVPTPGPSVNGYSVTVTITPDPSCKPNSEVYNLTASAGPRQGQAQVALKKGKPATLNWYSLQ